MARYYTENIDGRIRSVVAQDETGLYGGAIYRIGAEAPALRTVQHWPPSMLWIKLPEWPEPREVSTTSRDYLECRRRVERGSYTTTIASGMQEMPGTAEEVIRRVLEQASPDRVCIIDMPAPAR